MSNYELVLRLFLQLTVIIAVCRAVTWLGQRYLGQTSVVCEMIAGVMMGPSLFGLLAPDIQQWLFPKAALVLANGDKIPNPSMSILFALSQLGLTIYMFLVGLEFNTDLVRKRMHNAGLVSGAGILVPFSLGAIASLFLYRNADLFSSKITALSAALYLGASMSITAFPMLARMLYERKLTKTRMGTLALAAGSMDDAIAWCLLAIVLASFKNSPNIAAMAIGGGFAYVLFQIFVGHPGWKSFERALEVDGHVSRRTLGSILIVLLLCAWFTDFVGIHAVFGAFILGTVMPKGPFAEQVQEKLEGLTVSFLLPIFFVFSGLNTQIGLVNTPQRWGVTLVLVAIAILGKGLACTLAAKAAGETWREASTIGALMNARGLMELIILNIGLDAGVITPTLFTMMVIMAVITTVMASPIVNVLLRGTLYAPEALAAPGGLEAAMEGVQVGDSR
jgi:Kef-type K+ transport system membrane component KefB